MVVAPTLVDAAAAVDAVSGAAADAYVAERPSTSSLFLMIDDMDHEDGVYPPLQTGSSGFWWRHGPLGNWFVSSPQGIGSDAQIDDIVPPRGESRRACHVTGTKLERGIDLWAQLNHPGNLPIDLRAYAGIAFWARLKSASGRIVVALNDRRSSSYFVSEASNSPWPSRKVAVSEDWQRFVLLFDDFSTGASATGASAKAVDTSAVISIDFVAGAGGETFDLWIDDLALLCRGVCPVQRPVRAVSGASGA